MNSIKLLAGEYSLDYLASLVADRLGEQICQTSNPYKPKFPKWEELGQIKGWYVDDSSELDSISFDAGSLLLDPCDKNVWPTKELAEASLALSQLAQLRDYVNGDWKPAWTADYTTKYIIYCNTSGILDCYEGENITQHFLAFKDAETRDGFLEAYRDLIEVAKPLL